MSKEIWKPIPGWRGFYEASNLGRMRSLARMIRRSDGTLQRVRERILRCAVDIEGYRRCTLRRNGKKFSAHLHTFIALAFHGKRPAGKEVRHLDGKKKNCRSKNLKYGTPKQNWNDKVRHGATNRGERNARAAFRRSEVLAIRQQYAAGAGTGQAELAKSYGATRNTIHKIIHRKTWAWL